MDHFVRRFGGEVLGLAPVAIPTVAVVFTASAALSLCELDDGNTDDERDDPEEAVNAGHRGMSFMCALYTLLQWHAEY